MHRCTNLDHKSDLKEERHLETDHPKHYRRLSSEETIGRDFELEQ